MSDSSTASLVFFLLSHLSAEEKEEKQQIKIYVFDFSLFFDVGGPTCEDNVCLYVRVCACEFWTQSAQSLAKCALYTNFLSG